MVLNVYAFKGFHLKTAETKPAVSHLSTISNCTIGHHNQPSFRMNKQTHINKYVYIYMHDGDTHTHTHIYIYIYIYINAQNQHIYIHIYTYIHLHMHIHIYTDTRRRNGE